jgi:protocatechuate 3,4-dioxygenase beta subunit
MDDHVSRIGRRALLLGAGALTLAACSREGSNGSTADGSSTDTSSDSPNTTDSGPSDTTSTSTTDARSTTAPSATLDEPPPLTAAQFAGLAACALLPDSAAGPFPTIEQLDRRDVTEGYPGHPLRLGVHVVDSVCRPVPGADVEIWHADASGDYSSYSDNGSGKDEAEGTTFLRGFQTTDADGITEFHTIYPGWYPGRAVHIHTRVRLDGTELLTAQLYFDESYTAQVYATAPYADFGLPDTSWASDRIAGDPATDGTGITLADGPTWTGEGTLGLATMGVST